MMVVPPFLTCTTLIVAMMGSYQVQRTTTIMATIGFHHHMIVPSCILSNSKPKTYLSFLGVHQNVDFTKWNTTFTSTPTSDIE